MPPIRAFRTVHHCRLPYPPPSAATDQVKDHTAVTAAALNPETILAYCRMGPRCRPGRGPGRGAANSLRSPGLPYSMDQCVQRGADTEEDGQAEQDPYGNSVGRGYRRPELAKSVERQPLGYPRLEIIERRSRCSSHVPLQAPYRTGSCRQCCFSQRDRSGDGIVLPVYRADVGGRQDRPRDKEIVDHLEAATDPRVIPDPGMI